MDMSKSILMVLVLTVSCGHGEGGTQGHGAPVGTAHPGDDARSQPSSLLPAASASNGSVADGGVQADPWIAHHREQIVAFLEGLKTAVKSDDKGALAKLVSFPVNVERLDDQKGKGALEKEQFLRAYAQIITPCIKRRILAATVDGLRANWQGFEIGRGQIWFSNTADGLRIVAFNNGGEWCAD